jgi:hypothetical protein
MQFLEGMLHLPRITIALADHCSLCPSLAVTQLSWRPQYEATDTTEGIEIPDNAEEALLAIAGEDSSLRILSINLQR